MVACVVPAMIDARKTGEIRLEDSGEGRGLSAWVRYEG